MIPLHFKNKHLNKKAYICCNGPGLADIDFSLINNDIIFCLNRGYLKQDMNFNYWVSVDPKMENHFRKEFNAVDCAGKFSHSAIKDSFQLSWNPSRKGTFETQFDVPFFQGYSTVISAITLAYWMGCNPVYLIGADHSLSWENTAKENGSVRCLGADKDHFDPNYCPSDFKFNKQPIGNVALYYNLAYKAFLKNNRIFLNASTFTKLSEDILPRIKFEDTL